MKNTTWKDVFGNIASNFLDSSRAISTLNQAFIFIAREWADLEMNPALPYYSTLCTNTVPIDISIQTMLNEPPQVRMVAKPYSPGLNTAEQISFIRARSKKFIQKYSGIDSLKFLNHTLSIFPDIEGRFPPDQQLLFLGLGLITDFLGNIHGSKIYFDLRAISPSYTYFGGIKHILSNLGFSGDYFLPLIDLTHNYNASIFGIGINFNRINVESFKIYLRLEISHIKLTDLVKKDESLSKNTDVTSLLSEIGNYSKYFVTDLYLGYKPKKFNPELMIQFICKNMFSSNHEVLDMLTQSLGSDHEILLSSKDYLVNNQEMISNIGLSGQGITLYFNIT